MAAMDKEGAERLTGNMGCECEFDVDPDDPADDWHFRRVCLVCGGKWYGLHCPHDRIQNPCPICGSVPEPVYPVEPYISIRDGKIYGIENGIEQEIDWKEVTCLSRTPDNEGGIHHISAKEKAWVVKPSLLNELWRILRL